MPACYAGLGAPALDAGSDPADDDDAPDDDDLGSGETPAPSSTGVTPDTGEATGDPDPSTTAPETTDPSTGEPATSTGEEVTWDPIVADGDRLYFVGNSYTGNTGELPNHMQQAWLSAATPIGFEHDANYYWGQGLGSMYTNEVISTIQSGQFDTCVITSGTVSQMQQFTSLINDNCGHFVVYMTWGLNPTIGSMEDYRAGTASIVSSMRQFESQADARIVPSGLLYWDLIDNPPREGLRLDWLYWPQNIHQNGAGIAVNTYVFYAALVGESPVGIDYELVVPWDGSVIVSGEQIATRQAAGGDYLYDELVFDEDLRTDLQQRAYDVTQAWVTGTTEFD